MEISASYIEWIDYIDKTKTNLLNKYIKFQQPSLLSEIKVQFI